MPTPASAPDPGADGTPTIASADNYWISVQIADAYAALLDADRLHRLAAFTLQQEGHPEKLEVGITVTDDAEIHALNKQYLDHDYPTDVLSFGGGPPRAARATPAAAAGDWEHEGADSDTLAPPAYMAAAYAEAAPPGAATQPAPGIGDPEGADSDTAVAAAVSFVTPPGWPIYLGDVVISYDTAAAQAADYGHSPAAEVDVLLVHGLLHLLGYDDAAPADRERMHQRQDEVLAAFTAS